MKSMKSCSTEYIPPEVLSQVFVHLPPKSLLRIRCVCKSWCSVIDDPDFVDMHFQFHNKKKINPDKILSFEGLGVCGQSGCLLTLRKADSLRKTGHIFKCAESYLLHGSCNSLLLISRSRNYLCKGMRLCNPSIRKSLLLPRCPLFPCSKYDAIYVLGFVPRSKDFKVIAISFKSFPGVYIREIIRLAVYTLGDRSWAVRDNSPNFDRLSKTHLHGPYYFCEGAAHWLGKDPFEVNINEGYRGLTHLVSLDFDTESFTFLKLPDALDEVRTRRRHMFLLGESLAFLCISAVSLKIWVSKQESGKREWTLCFVGPSSSDGFDMFRRGWGVVTRVLYYKGNGGGEIGGSLVYGNNSYNIATCKVQAAKSLSRYVEFETYSESMVLWKGYEVEDTASSPFCLEK